jgi:hypothetical protein
MVQGKVWHSYILPTLIKNSEYGKSGFFNKPKYEVDAYYDDPRGFKIHGHIDVDIPAFDRIVEFKTTESDRFYEIGDFLTDAYFMQANAEAMLKHRKHFEVWILRINFENINSEKDHFLSILQGDTSDEMWTEYLDRVNFVHEAIKQGINLASPEQRWECKYCSYFLNCFNWEQKIKNILEQLPQTKVALCGNKELEETFDIIALKGLIKYNRTAKVYELRKEESETT